VLKLISPYWLIMCTLSTVLYRKMYRKFGQFNMKWTSVFLDGYRHLKVRPGQVSIRLHGDREILIFVSLWKSTGHDTISNCLISWSKFYCDSY
jgi:hypothetical protein